LGKGGNLSVSGEDPANNMPEFEVAGENEPWQVLAAARRRKDPLSAVPVALHVKCQDF